MQRLRSSLTRIGIHRLPRLSLCSLRMSSSSSFHALALAATGPGPLSTADDDDEFEIIGSQSPPRQQRQQSSSSVCEEIITLDDDDDDDSSSTKIAAAAASDSASSSRAPLGSPCCSDLSAMGERPRSKAGEAAIARAANAGKATATASLVPSGSSAVSNCSTAPAAASLALPVPSRGPRGSSSSVSAAPAEGAANTYGSGAPFRAAAPAAAAAAPTAHSSAAASPAPSAAPPRAGAVRVLSWNLDGLSAEGLSERAAAAAAEMVTLAPDVILLQELVPTNKAIIEKRLKAAGYTYHDAELDAMFPYHCGILLRRERAKLIDCCMQPFLGSQMGRHLLTVIAEVGGIPMTFITTHLESCVEGATQRKVQLRVCLNELKDAPTAVSVVAGDTNLREKEVADTIGKQPGDSRVSDCWEAAGRPADARYTWDMATNTNLSIPNPIRMRFDRMFVVNATDYAVRVSSFKLAGTKRLTSLPLHPSDHYGILATLQVTAK